ncbi:hypothetical protein TUM3794_19910 [Shewanella colwelliana]|uniref:Uncharacterized protein n=1 Tax=Shewanella colwelliana TaxID=23 RepID=A0ABQ4P095_SHECO|nr:hypothetical protein [Shewanella colwelliana]GIU40891.1 hypothetical protein TUM3794_19910 [Shewanella colwelliana]
MIDADLVAASTQACVVFEAVNLSSEEWQVGSKFFADSLCGKHHIEGEVTADGYDFYQPKSTLRVGLASSYRHLVMTYEQGILALNNANYSVTKPTDRHEALIFNVYYHPDGKVWAVVDYNNCPDANLTVMFKSELTQWNWVLYEGDESLTTQKGMDKFNKLIRSKIGKGYLLRDHLRKYAEVKQI